MSDTIHPNHVIPEVFCLLSTNCAASHACNQPSDLFFVQAKTKIKGMCVYRPFFPPCVGPTAQCACVRLKEPVYILKSCTDFRQRISCAALVVCERQERLFLRLRKTTTLRSVVCCGFAVVFVRFGRYFSMFYALCGTHAQQRVVL